ncbi:hypothetical protein JCM12294_19840 [Desulfocicer niacini]
MLFFGKIRFHYYIPARMCIINTFVLILYLKRISRAILPFIMANIIIVLLITYIPAITLFIPGLFN